MSVAAVCRSSASSSSGFESILMLSNRPNQDSIAWLTSSLPLPPPPLFEIDGQKKKNHHEDQQQQQPDQLDIWASIQSQKAQQQQQKQIMEEQEQGQGQSSSYVHPLLRRSSSLLSQKSLEICTESLGSETGSDDYISSSDVQITPKDREHHQQETKKLKTVATPSSPIKRGSFPPPLPSISRQNGPCLQMKTHRQDGRLILQAVSTPPQNLLHAHRTNGRLLLSFTTTTTTNNFNQSEQEVEEEEAEEEDVAEAEEEEEEEEEEEVEVVDRGTVVEVKVSTQPQHQMKVHRSSIVINKFVSCSSSNLIPEDQISSPAPRDKFFYNPTTSRKLLSTATTTAAAAAVAASSVSVFSDEEAAEMETAAATDDEKLLFTSSTTKRRNREELLHDMRRCSQLRKPLFIWEPCCIATSS